MKDKIAHVHKLMGFLDLDRVKLPTPLPPDVRGALQERMKKPERLDSDFDVVDVTYSKVAQPEVVEVFTAYESRHNGSFFDKHTEIVPLHDAFLDFAIKLLRNRAYEKIRAILVTEEHQRMQKRVEARLKELGL